MSDDFVYEEGPVRYAVEYLIKGETLWRRTMEHLKEDLDSQAEVLWENPSMAATRQVVITELVRLLSASEKRHNPGHSDLPPQGISIYSTMR